MFHMLPICGIDRWDISSVTDLTSAFQQVTHFSHEDLPIGNWDVSNVTSLVQTFNGFQSQLPDLGAWDVSSVSNMRGLFCCYRLNVSGIDRWNTPSLTNISYLFYSCGSEEALNLENWDVSNVSNMEYAFAMMRLSVTGIDRWDVSNVESMDSMFSGIFENPMRFYLGDWNVSKVKTMKQMFQSTGYLTGDIGIDAWDVSSVDTFEEMFQFTHRFRGDLRAWKIKPGACTNKIFGHSHMSARFPLPWLENNSIMHDNNWLIRKKMVLWRRAMDVARDSDEAALKRCIRDFRPLEFQKRLAMAKHGMSKEKFAELRMQSIRYNRIECLEMLHKAEGIDGTVEMFLMERLRILMKQAGGSAAQENYG